MNTIKSGVDGYNLRKLPKRLSSESQYVVVNAQTGREIGLVTKIRDTRTDTHPWKAFASVPVRPDTPFDCFYRDEHEDALTSAVRFVLLHAGV